MSVVTHVLECKASLKSLMTSSRLAKPGAITVANLIPRTTKSTDRWSKLRNLVWLLLLLLLLPLVVQLMMKPLSLLTLEVLPHHLSVILILFLVCGIGDSGLSIAVSTQNLIAANLSLNSCLNAAILDSSLDASINASST